MYRRSFCLVPVLIAFLLAGFSFGADASTAPCLAPQEEPVEEVQEEEAEEEETDAVDEALEDLEEAPAADPLAKPAFEVHGAVNLSYRARLRDDDDNDEDFYGYFRLDGARPSQRDFSFHVYGRATYDIDGDITQANNPFFSLNDVSRDRLEVRLYEAFVDLEGDLAPTGIGIRRIRLGRQRVNAGISFLVDGARLDFRRIEGLNIDVSIFGGIPEYLYEDNREGDWLVGIDVNARPTDRTRIDLRYVHIKDKNEWVGGEQNDDYLSIGLMQQFTDMFRVFGNWNLVGWDTRDVSLRLNIDIRDWDLTINASYFYQDTVTQEFSTLLDAYVGILGVSFAYHQASLEITKLYGDHFAVDLGATIRELEDNDDEAAFNREFQRVWVTASSYDWPIENLGLSLTFEWWNADQDETITVGGEVNWRPLPELRLSAGSFYAAYKYDFFVVDERVDVTTIFLRVRWQVLEDLRLNGRYEFETGDEGDFHFFWAGFDWRF